MMNLRTLVDPDATPAYPIVRSVGQADLTDALAKSVNDFLPMLDLWAEPLFLVSLSIMSTPEQKCVGWPEQKYIGDAGRKAPNWGPFLRASGLGRIIHRGVSTGAA